MKSFVFVDFIVFTFVLFAVAMGYSDAQMDQSKNRRAGGVQSGLFAFPRVGRSDPSLTNNLHEAQSALDGLYAASYEEYEEFPKVDMKRASMMDLPRVGRNDAELRKWTRLLQQALDKRAGPSATSGLWFGPRLGKRSISAQEQKNAAKLSVQKENF